MSVGDYEPILDLHLQPPSRMFSRHSCEMVLIGGRGGEASKQGGG
jgi:hypothetical protein